MAREAGLRPEPTEARRSGPPTNGAPGIVGLKALCTLGTTQGPLHANEGELRMAGKEEIENAVITAIKDAISEETSGEFSWGIVPAKRLSDGGLGATWNGWRAIIGTVISKLPEAHPYSSLVIDVVLVDETYTKTLHTLRNRLVERLLLINKYEV